MAARKSIATSSTATGTAYEAFMNNEFNKCKELLTKSINCSINECERRRLKCNLALCEAKRDAKMFHPSYQSAILDIFPHFNLTDLKQPLCDYDEFVAAFNLSLNAFVRGNVKTGLKLLHAVMAVRNLPDYLFCRVHMLEIEMSLALCEPILASKQADKLRGHPSWLCATAAQRDCLDCLECRIRHRFSKTPPSTDFLVKPQVLHWCLIQSEFDMGSGNSQLALSRLQQIRPSLQDEDRRLVDNAIGCIYAVSLKKPSIAESFFRSAMRINQSKRTSWQESTIPKHCLIYHTALAQLHCGQVESAFKIFSTLLPFYPRQPRIWLRIAECCIQALSSKNNDLDPVNSPYGPAAKRVQKVIGSGFHRHFIFPISSSRNENLDVSASESVASNEISWNRAAYCIRTALPLTSFVRDDCDELQPWLYASSAFIDLHLDRYELALKAATELANLPHLSLQHKLIAILYRAEALVLLDRSAEAMEFLNVANSLQSIPPSTMSAVFYNRSLLQALHGNFRKSLSSIIVRSRQHKVLNLLPETASLEVYVNAMLGRYNETKRLAEERMLKK